MSHDLLIKNALIFDGHSPDLREGSILIRNGEIAAFDAKSASGVEVLDAGGRVVSPGFIDCHFHAYGIDLDMMRLESTPRSYVALKGHLRLEAALRRGFTTVRDVAGGDSGLALAIREGLIESPNYYYTGPALSQTGGHGDGRHPVYDMCCADGLGVEVVDGVDPLRVAVRDRLRKGAHAIKIMASGGVVSLTDPIRIPQYSGEEIRAVTEEAGRRGSYVAAHAYSPEAIVHAVTNGVRSIEHANLLDDESAAVMAAHSAVMIPTLVTYQMMAEKGAEIGMVEIALKKNHEVLASGKTAIEIATRHGILVGFGTDLMGDLEYAQLRGLEIQHEVQGTLELMRSITSRNAQVIGNPKHGSVAVGSFGDLVVLDGNPFEKPSVLWNMSEGRTVIKSGRVVK
jgi:imidazolonepropionase-like amidohydrolase